MAGSLDSMGWLAVSAALALSGAGQAASRLDAQWIRTDAKTGAFIRKALEEGQLDAASFTARLDELKRSGRVEELAAFQQEVTGESPRFDLQKDADHVEVAEDERYPVGIQLELAPSLRGGWADLSYQFRHAAKQGRNRIDEASVQGVATIGPDRWELLGGWGDGESERLLLASVTGGDGELPPGAAVREVFLDCELREASGADLETFGRATPETRAKAVEWLRSRSSVLATAHLRSSSALRVAFRDSLNWVHEDDDEWDTAELGLMLDADVYLGPAARLMDVSVVGRWHPRDAPRPPDEPQFRLVGADTVTSGETLLIEPQARPDSGPVPVLLVTATARSEGADAGRWEQGILPAEGEIGVRSYRVHPRFARAMWPGDLRPRGSGLAERLKEHGLEFPEGTRATFMPGTSEVVLQHQRGGHAKFEEILQSLDLAFPPGGE